MNARTFPLDPPEALEGPNAGLVEATAEQLWRARSPRVRRNLLTDWDDQSEAVKAGWRAAALDLLTWLGGLGFTGPGGPPRAPAEGLSYAWLYVAAQWEIIDAEKGFVAMVADERDVPLFLAMPGMRAAIGDVVARFDKSAMIRRRDIEALRAALPVIP